MFIVLIMKSMHHFCFVYDLIFAFFFLAKKAHFRKMVNIVVLKVLYAYLNKYIYLFK